MIRGPIPREHQAKFKSCFPEGVIEIEDDEAGEPQCVVKNPRKDTVSREVLRHPEFEDLVELARIRDHFLCKLPSPEERPGNGGDERCRLLTLVNVESAGQYSPELLVPKAIDIMLGKIAEVEAGLDKLFSDEA